MKMVKTCFRQIAIGILMLTCVFCLSGISWAEDFSADIVSTSQGSTPMDGTSKLYMKGNLMRMAHERAVTISRPDKGVMWILMQDQKMYMEHPYQVSGNLQEWTPNMEKSAKNIGKETLSGLSCTKYEMSTGEGKVYYWISDKIPFPVKIQGRDGNMELKNIKIGKVSDSLFEIPAGYSKFSMPSMGGNMPGMTPGGRGVPSGHQ